MPSLWLVVVSWCVLALGIACTGWIVFECTVGATGSTCLSWRRCGR